MNSTAFPVDATADRDTRVWGMHPAQLALLGVVLVTLFRFGWMCCVGLVPDEAYFWVWSKHLAISYRDKGPLVAWTIAVGTRLFGDSVFGVRFFAVLLSAGTAFQLFRLARRLYDDRTALWCLAVALVMPVFAVGSILMTIDPLSVFFWAWGANLLWSGLESGKIRYWILFGLAVGIGFLAKFINMMQLISLVLFLSWSRPHRKFLFSRQSLAALLAAGVSSFPIFWWNVQTGWVHVSALRARSGIHQTFSVHPTQFLQYLGAVLAVVSPLIMIGIIVAVVGLWRSDRGQARVKFLLSLFLPIQIMYLILGLNSKGQPNWIAPTLVSGIVLLVVFWRRLIERIPKWRWAAWWALGLALAMTLFLHVVYYLRLPVKLDPLRRAESWPDFAEHVQKARQQHHADLLIANNYAPSSILQFYIPDHPFVYVTPDVYGKNQFTLWPGYEVVPGTRALYVSDCAAPVPQRVLDQFSRSEVVDDFWTQHRGRPTERFSIYLLVKD